MPFVDTQPQQIADLLKSRLDAVDRAERARAKGFISLADEFDRVVAGWDSTLARYGVAPGTV
jgi:hypothetical protein